MQMSCEYIILQIENDAGVWVRLTSQAIRDLHCGPDCTEAYALAFSKEKNAQFLEEFQVNTFTSLDVFQ